jgi:hypothetical protein
MKKGLLLLYGETFRLGSQSNRNTGSVQSYDEQIRAAHTHVNLISHLKKQDIHMEVSINSYTTPYNEDLCRVYKDVRYSIFYTHLIGQTELIHRCINSIDIQEYDFILCMRIDIYLKDTFVEIFNPHSNNIMFPSICFEPYHKTGIHPRVNDMMMYIPKRLLEKFKQEKVHLKHETWHDLIEYHHLSYHDLDMMLDTYHDSDSEKDYNPIYYIVNRPQSTVHTTQKKFDKLDFYPVS